MSNNITIQEGGKGYHFGPVKCLMVEGDNGELCPWYPEADRTLESLSVTKNGVYQAGDKGVYGWNQVVANVETSDRVIGKDPDTGEEEVVTVDPDTGELIETIIPVEIRITTLPNKTEYYIGETIDYSGIVVHAYSSTGQDMGAIPFSELVFPITTAQGGDDWSDGAGINAKMIYYVPSWRRDVSSQGQETEVQVFCCTEELGTDEYNRPCSYGGVAPGTLMATRFGGYNYLASISGDRKASRFSHFNGSNWPYDTGSSYGWRNTGGSTAEAGDGIFKSVAFEDNITSLPVSTVNPNDKSVSTLHAIQSLPVQWNRTGDGAILETSFDITVTGGE